MSAIQKQQPHINNYLEDKYIHLNNSDSFNSFYNATEYDVKLNYIKSNSTSWTNRQFRIAEAPSQNYAYFNTKSLIDIDFTFQPTITTWTPTNDIALYYLSYKEIDDSTYTNGYNQLVLRGNRNDFNLYEHTFDLNTHTGKFLTQYNSEYTRTLHSTDTQTLRFLNGDLKKSISGTIKDENRYFSKAKYMHLEVSENTDDYDVDLYYVNDLSPNNYFGYNFYVDYVPYGFYTGIKNHLIEIPSGPENLNSMTGWRLYRIKLNRGTYDGYTSDTRVYIDNGNPITTDTKSYNVSIVGYDVSNLLRNSINFNMDAYIYSQKITFKINNCNKAAITQIAWSNNVGGVDYFTAFGNIKYNDNTTKNYYDINNQTDNNGIRYIKDFNKDKNVYNLNTNTTLEVNTGRIQKKDIKYLSQIYNSDNVYVKIDDKWYYVVLTSTPIDYDKYFDKVENFNLKFLINRPIDDTYENPTTTDFGFEFYIAPPAP